MHCCHSNAQILCFCECMDFAWILPELFVTVPRKPIVLLAVMGHTVIDTWRFGSLCLSSHMLQKIINAYEWCEFTLTKVCYFKQHSALQTLNSASNGTLNNTSNMHGDASEIHKCSWFPQRVLRTAVFLLHKVCMWFCSTANFSCVQIFHVP